MSGCYALKSTPVWYFQQKYTSSAKKISQFYVGANLMQIHALRKRYSEDSNHPLRQRNLANPFYRKKINTVVNFYKSETRHCVPNSKFHDDESS